MSVFGGGFRLSSAGFVATAIAFGPARNGYGLFLPYFREEFGLSTALLGIIASGLYAGYLLALSAVGLLASRIGPRPLIIVGLLAAVSGMMLVAFARDAWMLAIGVVLAGTSAGWTWAPYNDAADRMVSQQRRGRVLSVVSTGATFGILASGLIALLAKADWRVAWMAFAVAAVAATVPNALILPSGAHSVVDSETHSGTYGSVSKDPGDSRESSFLSFRSGWNWMVRPESKPLFVVAASFGLVSAYYYSFAVDLVVSTGGFSQALGGPILYIVIGATGFSGLLTGDAVSRFGLGKVLFTALACMSIASFLLGVAQSSWAVIVISASLFGASVMVMSAMLAVWSSVVFAEQPSTGFSATLLIFGLGLMIGPAALGALAGSTGLEIAFLTAAAIALLTGLVRPRVRE